MGLSPLLLLSLLTFLKDASSESCPTSGFGFNQPRHLHAFEGSSIHINFSFYYPWKLADNPDVKISLRWKNFHGESIYNETGNFTHVDIMGRLTLERTEGKDEGVFLIRGLRKEDATTYFCQVQLKTQDCGEITFQSIEGTRLTITPASSKSYPKFGFRVNQPEHLQAFEGGSVHINFSFYYPQKLADNPDVKIFLRWKTFHGDVIYNETGNFTHEEFKDRLTMERTEGKDEGIFLIRGLRREDATKYFCRVQMKTKISQKSVFQSIKGTRLTITPVPSEKYRVNAGTGVNQPEDLQVHEGNSICTPFLSTTLETQRTGFLHSADILPVTLIIFLFKITILGLITYLVWKRSQGFKGAASLSGDSPVNQSTDKRGGHSFSENPVTTNI